MRSLASGGTRTVRRHADRFVAATDGNSSRGRSTPSLSQWARHVAARAPGRMCPYSTIRAALASAPQAGIRVPADETTAWDEEQASASGQSAPALLLDLWEGSSAAIANGVRCNGRDDARARRDVPPGVLEHHEAPIPAARATERAGPPSLLPKGNTSSAKPSSSTPRPNAPP